MAVSPTHDAKMKDADGSCFADYPGCHECIRAIHSRIGYINGKDLSWQVDARGGQYQNILQ